MMEVLLKNGESRKINKAKPACAGFNVIMDLKTAT